MSENQVKTYPNGDKYEGQLKDDEKNGVGTYYFVNSDKYEGQWLDNEKHG